MLDRHRGPTHLETIPCLFTGREQAMSQPPNAAVPLDYNRGIFRVAAYTVLYRVPEIVTRGRFPDGGESDSTWRTQEARHVGSDTIAPGF
jgi:hypothetical protein